MSRIRAFVCDLDGTLLNADHSVPSKYDELFRFLTQHDIRFIVASARPFGNILKLFEGHPTPTGIVACDGAIMAALSNGTMVHYSEKCLGQEHVRTLFPVIKSAGVNPILFLTREDDYSVIIGQADAILRENLINSDPTRPVIEMGDAEICKLCATAPVRALSALSGRANIAVAFRKVALAAAGFSDIRVYSYEETRFGNSAYGWLDVVSDVNRKEEAIEAVLRSHGIAGCEFVGCGNGENDIGMLKKATLSFCPANSVASVRNTCSSIAPIAEGGGFVEWVLARLKEELNGE